MPEWLAIVIAIISGGALTKLIDSYFSRRKMNGSASLAYAQASGLVATQNADLMIEIKRLRAELTDAYCEIKGLKAEVTELRLALGRQLDKQE